MFSIKNFEQPGNQIIPTEIVNLNHREIHHIHENRYNLASNCEVIESNSPLIVRKTIAVIFSLGTCIVQIQNVSSTLCLPKKTFQFQGRSDYHCPQCASVCHVCNIREDQTNSFFLSFGQGVHISEEKRKSIQDVIGDVYCPGKYCLNREKCQSFDGYVTTPRSIYGCGKCGAWLFVHKVPFTLQGHIKMTKTDKNTLFLS